METITTQEQFNEITSQGVSLIDFAASWCMPCKMMAPLLDDLGKKFEGRARFATLDVDEAAKVAVPFNISAVPTIMIFKDGNMADKLVGMQNQETLETAVEAVLKK
jgi:thioredoxin 1